MLSTLLLLSPALINIVSGIEYDECINAGATSGSRSLFTSSDDLILSPSKSVRFVATTGGGEFGCLQTQDTGSTTWGDRWCLSWDTQGAPNADGDTITLEPNGNLTYWNGNTRLWSSDTGIGLNTLKSFCVKDCGNMVIKRADNSETLWDVGVDIPYGNLQPTQFKPYDNPACFPSSAPTMDPTSDPTIITDSPTMAPTQPTPAPTDDGHMYYVGMVGFMVIAAICNL